MKKEEMIDRATVIDRIADVRRFIDSNPLITEDEKKRAFYVLGLVENSVNRIPAVIVGKIKEDA